LLAEAFELFQVSKSRLMAPAEFDTYKRTTYRATKAAYISIYKLAKAIKIAEKHCEKSRILVEFGLIFCIFSRSKGITGLAAFPGTHCNACSSDLSTDFPVVTEGVHDTANPPAVALHNCVDNFSAGRARPCK